MKFQIGDAVKVKSGTKAPDFEIDIGNWQGWISEIDDEMICITWDSITLSNFPDKYISQCEEEGLDWEEIYLSVHDIEKTIPRDSNTDLNNQISIIQSKHNWDYLGESGKRIQKVLEDVDFQDDIAAFEAWETYLDGTLSFPVDAEISKYETKGPLQDGDKIIMHNLMGSENLHGVMVKIKLSGRVYHFPLCEIEVSDKTSNNYKLVKDYCVWFANR